MVDDFLGLTCSLVCCQCYCFLASYWCFCQRLFCMIYCFVNINAGVKFDYK